MDSLTGMFPKCAAQADALVVRWKADVTLLRCIGTVGA